MFLNDKKGSYGCFSNAGKSALKMYKNLVSNPLKIKPRVFNKFDNLFNQQLLNEFRKERELNDKGDIFKLDEYELKKLKELTKNKTNKKLKKSKFNRCQSAKIYNKNKLKFNKIKKKKNEKNFEPNCTKYKTKKNIILKRSPSCPSWSKLTSRPNYIKEDNFPFYINPKNILENTAGKSFIDMSKQTKRNLSFENENNKKNYKKRPKSSLNLSKSYSNTTIFLNKTRPQTGIIRRKSSLKYNLSKSKIIENENNITTTSLEDSYEEYKNIYIKQLKKSKSIEKNEDNNIKKKIKAPNFDQFISREDYDKLKDKNSVIPFSLPNYQSIRGKPIMMVIYNTKKHRINKVKSNLIKKMDNSYYFDPYKSIDKYNNHKVIHAPNFNLMTSRPNDNINLPVYMKQIYSKASCYNITSLSLKMNNFSNGRFSNVHSSFFPKKSFNQIINLNLLNSQKFLENVIGNKKKFIKKHYDIGKAMKFYNKNYEELLKDELLTRFDNVTYKTIKKNNSVDMKEMENFLIKTIEQG